MHGLTLKVKETLYSKDQIHSDSSRMIKYILTLVESPNKCHHLLKANRNSCKLGFLESIEMIWLQYGLQHLDRCNKDKKPHHLFRKVMLDEVF